MYLPWAGVERLVQDLCPQTYKASKHHCHMFRSAELRAFLEGRGATVEDMSACAALSVSWEEKLVAIRQVPRRWQHLLELEVEACREPGALDMGTHLIAVARKPLSPVSEATRGAILAAGRGH